MVEIQINPDFKGPTILELEPILGDIQGTPQVRWQGTRAEFLTLEQHPRKFILHVPDITAMEKTATMLGNEYTFDSAILQQAFQALTGRQASWRSFCEGVGPAVTRSLLIRISARAIRKGQGQIHAKIASESLIEGVNPIDADILLRIRVLKDRSK